MTRPRYGIQISQEGIPVRRAADYQKVLDDRWPFLDIVIETEVRFEHKFHEGNDNYRWSIELLDHSLGYLPAFTYRMVEGSLLDEFGFDIGEVVSTKQGIYLKGFFIPGQQMTLNGKILLRVFACDITAETSYGVGQIDPIAKRDSRKYGAKILKSGVPPEKFSGDEMSDFALNTDAKALAIQKTGVFHLNPYIELDQARVSAISTSANTLTLQTINAEDDIGWSAVRGQAAFYLPGDFVTYPNPLSGNTYYLIPEGSGAVKLANSYQNALNGIEIDLTTAGSLPGSLSAAENPSSPEDTLEHDVGYPPSYWMARYEPWSVRGQTADDVLPGEDIIYPADKGFEQGFTYATTTTLRFRGAQAVAGGRYAYIIFKDPLERAV